MAARDGPAVNEDGTGQPTPRVPEYDMVQNPALGAVTLWTFIRAYAEVNPHGPSVAHALVVLPITFHEKSRHSLMRRRPSGGLFTALAQDRTLFAGLQERLLDMTPVSWRSLNIALAAGLVQYDPLTARFTLTRRTRPYQLNQGEIPELFHAAERLGKWMADLDQAQLYGLLRVSF